MLTKTTFSLKGLACLCLLLFLSFPLFSQIDLQSHPIQLSSEESLALDEQIAEYSAYLMHPQAVYNDLQESGEPAILNINLSEEINWTFQMHVNDLRPDNYYIIGEEEEESIIVNKEKEILLSGIINDDTEQVIYFYATDQFFTAQFIINEEWYVLEPLESITGISEYKNQYILYKKTDKYFSTNLSGGCLTENALGGGDGPCPELNQYPLCTTSPVVSKDGIQRYLEVAVDVDFEFFNRYKNKFSHLGLNPLKSVEKEVLDRLGSVDAVYQKYFDLHIKLVYLHVWQYDGLYDSSNPEELWKLAKSFWNGSGQCIHRDLLLLFSGKDFSKGCGFVHWAGQGAVCNENIVTNSNEPLNAYAVIADGNYKLIAHEIGHLLGADHAQTDHLCKYLCDQQNTATIMCQGWCGGGTDKFLAHIQCQIYGFLQNSDCLENCAPASGQSPRVEGPNDICLNEDASYQIIAATNGPYYWVLGPNLTLNSGSLSSEEISVTATASGSTYLKVFFYHHCKLMFIRKSIDVNAFKIKELIPMCSADGCGPLDQIGQYTLQRTCDGTYQYACWAFSHPDNYYPFASQQDPFCTAVLFAYPVVDVSNQYLTLYAYDPNDPSVLLAKRDFFIPACDLGGPCLDDPGGPSFSQRNPKENNHLFPSESFAFPNPADDLLTIHFPSFDGQATLSVWDIQEKPIFHQTILSKQERVELPVKNWKQGFYFIEIKTAKSTHLQKAIIQH